MQTFGHFAAFETEPTLPYNQYQEKMQSLISATLDHHTMLLRPQNNLKTSKPKQEQK